MARQMARRTSQAGRTPRNTTRQRSAVRRRSAMTLIEVMVAITITLLIVLALVNAFQFASTQISDGRAITEMSGHLRNTLLRLQDDLDGRTAPIRPWATPLGYFEIYEGSWRDLDEPSSVTDSMIGDFDDRLMFTTRTTSEPFRGQFNGQTIEATEAEVVWWNTLEDGDGDALWDPGERFTLHRRALLIRPDLNDLVVDPSNGVTGLCYSFPTQPATIVDLMGMLSDFLSNNDVSVRVNVYRNAGSVTWGLTANSLEDLARREFRFGHLSISPASFGAGNPLDTTFFPYPQTNAIVPPPAIYNIADPNLLFVQRGVRTGEDVILPHCLALDVKVYDPTAIVAVHPLGGGAVSEVTSPADPGFEEYVPATWTQIGSGAYVDLFYAYPGTANQRAPYNSAVTWPASAASIFSGPWHPRSRIPALLPAAGAGSVPPTYYDTWSLHYERDGVDQDGDTLVDEGLDGLDNGGVNGAPDGVVDDVNERETSPPYPFPLRGVKVTLRTIDKDTRQVRQASAVASFKPE